MRLAVPGPRDAGVEEADEFLVFLSLSSSGTRKGKSKQNKCTKYISDLK